MNISHGLFQLYTPDLPEDDPLVQAKALFVKNAEGVDWYDFVRAKRGTADRMFVMIHNGVVSSFSQDAETLWPIDCVVVETDDLSVRDGYRWVEGNLLPPLPVPAHDLVRAEAQKRIYKKFPAWKQANMTARSAELFRIQAGFMVDDTGAFLPARALTAEEKAEEIAIKRAWDWIKAVRATSDNLETAGVLPEDYAADHRWPS